MLQISASVNSTRRVSLKLKSPATNAPCLDMNSFLKDERIHSFISLPIDIPMDALALEYLKFAMFLVWNSSAPCSWLAMSAS